MYLSLNRGRTLPPSQVLNGSAFDTLFGDFFGPSGIRDPQAPSTTTLAPRFDVIEKDDRYEARLEIPGVAKEDIDVQIDGTVVRVKAEAKAEDKAVEGERVLHSSRTTRSWAGSFTLPAEVADDRAEAAYENGVLTLVLPKKEVAQPKRLAIK